MAKCLFLAPMKPPDDAVPSGDRAVAGLYMKLLARLGFEVEIASRLRTRLRDGSEREANGLEAAAAAEIDRIMANARECETSPAFVFTYHCYYKAPDLIGPAVAKLLRVPYMIAEASRAPKQAAGRYAWGHARATEAMDAADLIFAVSGHDRQTLDRFRRPNQQILDLKPFIDAEEWPEPAIIDRGLRNPAHLLTVAMMRPGNKTASYMALAETLKLTPATAWRLDVVGDGTNRNVVRGLFQQFGSNVTFHGRIDDRRTLAEFYRSADIFVWPGVNESYGMVYLEAQAHGTPCIGAAYRGVPDMIRDGETGLVPPPDDPASVANALASLTSDNVRYRHMRASAADFARDERSLDRAAAIAASAFARLGLLAGS